METPIPSALVTVKMEEVSESEIENLDEDSDDAIDNDYYWESKNNNFRRGEKRLERLENGWKKPVSIMESLAVGVLPSASILGASLGPLSECFHCKKVVPSPAALAGHLTTCTPKGADEKFKCDVCGTGLSSAANLRRHKLSHSGERPYRCDLCSAAFIRQAHLNDHKRKHTGEKAYVCSTCGSAFTQLSNLRTHEKQHSGIRKKKSFRCEVCCVEFEYSSSLRAHMVSHSGERPYQCEVCHATFKHQQNLVVHRRRHTGERPYQCETCGACFSQNQDLKVHCRTHTGEKPYVCSQCGAAFTQLHSLYAHKRRHGDVRPYACDICGASFVTKDKMRLHIRIHTGERPHSCSICSKAFITASDLNRHRRTHQDLKGHWDNNSNKGARNRREVPMDMKEKVVKDSHHKSATTKESSHQNEINERVREDYDEGNRRLKCPVSPAPSIEQEKIIDADVLVSCGMEEDTGTNPTDCNKSALDLSIKRQYI